ncbi:MAG: 4-hydroxy-3-methylbut-2-enyl diphosphate reductase [Erysipelotrichaceae bacterium]|nr:4-hydroxy-3-methylbut-2-enyl diphosphate reductase [Erysipelotrichaceae bacterium]
MKVIGIIPRGYCKGVVNAIRIAQETRKQYPDQAIYVLGMLVHNKFVIEALNKLDIITLDDANHSRLELLDAIKTGIVIFSAHGVSQSVYHKAQSKGLITVDATCVDVKHTQEIILQYCRNGYQILYIGIKGHPEAEAVRDLHPNIHMIYQEQDLCNLRLDDAKIMVTNQTTMNVNDLYSIHQIIQRHYANPVILEEICPATRIRQEAVLNLDQVDLCYIVGDPKSNNTRSLAKLAEQRAAKVRMIEHVRQIDTKDLADVMTVAVTSGASTPNVLTDQVIIFLNNYHPGMPLPEVATKLL